MSCIGSSMSPICRNVTYESYASYQHALYRARDRLIYCRKQRIAYEAYANDTEQSQRTLRKLREDEKRAQLDCSWAEHRLSEILATDEATTAFKAKVAGLDL
jgi:hypothetical protein